MAERARIKLTVNGKRYLFTVAEAREPGEEDFSAVHPWEKLVKTLRDKLGLKGTKLSCDSGACGACTVLMNGRLTLSCLTLTVDCDGAEITTIEGLTNPATGELHPIQQAFIENNGTQCGFCAPGMVLAAKALLDKNPNPTPEDVKWALAGNICRCGNYNLITKSVLAAAGKIREERGIES